MTGRPYDRRTWRPVETRTEPVGATDLLIRVTLVRHRREPERWALLTECLRRGDGGQELIILGTATWLVLPEPEQPETAEWAEMVDQIFDDAIERIRGTSNDG